MSEDNKTKALDALEKILNIINGVKDILPQPPKEKMSVNLDNPKYADPLKILKRVMGIVGKPTEEDAERRLKDLMGFLGTTLRKKL